MGERVILCGWVQYLRFYSHSIQSHELFFFSFLKLSNILTHNLEKGRSMKSIFYFSYFNTVLIFNLSFWGIIWHTFSFPVYLKENHVWKKMWLLCNLCVTVTHFIKSFVRSLDSKIQPVIYSFLNYFSFDRQGLFVILRDFSGMTQVLIPQEEVSCVSVAGVFNGFM